MPGRPDGWYEDPSDPSLYRHWDGTQWTEETMPRLVPSPQPHNAGWFEDPEGRHERRYFDGTAWTMHVSDQGRPSLDSIEVSTRPGDAVSATSEAAVSAETNAPRAGDLGAGRTIEPRRIEFTPLTNIRSAASPAVAPSPATGRTEGVPPGGWVPWVLGVVVLGVVMLLVLTQRGSGGRSGGPSVGSASSWRTTLGKVSCLPMTPETECQVTVKVVNDTSGPLAYGGSGFFVVVDGRTYASVSQVDSGLYNPGNGPGFGGMIFRSLPCGGVITAVFSADSADGPRLFSVPANLTIACG